MIHTMPDKTVRVTSRFPQGQSTVYFDLRRADGFTLEEDRFRPETVTIQMLGGTTSSSARYGSAVEAEADLADLILMLADRHSVAPPTPDASLAPSTVTPEIKRKAWGWTGAMAGMALGAAGAFLLTNLHAANVAARASLHAALDDTLPSVPSGLPRSTVERAPSPVAPAIAQQQAAAASILPPSPRPPAQPPAQARPPAPPPSFGLQP